MSKRFPRVTLDDARQLYDHPQELPGAPHRVPPGVPALSRSSPLFTDLESPQAPPTTPSAPGDGDALPFRDPHHYASLFEQTNVPIPNAVGGLMVLAEPANKRNWIMLRNNSAAANIFIAFGQAATANSVIRLTPNTMMLMDVVVPQDDMFAFADAAAGFLSFSYSTIL